MLTSDSLSFFSERANEEMLNEDYNGLLRRCYRFEDKRARIINDWRP